MTIKRFIKRFIPKNRKKAKTSTTDRIRTRKIIRGAKSIGSFKFNKAGFEMLKKHPLVYQAINEIISMDLMGMNLIEPEKVKTKRKLNHNVVKTVLEFQKNQINAFDKFAPFFGITKIANFGNYIIEKVSPKYGKVNIGMYRITASNGQSVLVKVQPQERGATSKMENLEIAQSLGFKTPKYFLEFNFPKFNIQVLEAMKLPNMKQLQKTNPITYRLIKKQFREEAKRLARKLEKRKEFSDIRDIPDLKEGNCLVLLRKGKLGRKKPYFYWIDL